MSGGVGWGRTSNVEHRTRGVISDQCSVFSVQRASALLLLFVASVAFAGDVELRCEPQALKGMPGEPLEVEVTATSDRATPMHLFIPAVSNLVLRTVEKIPIQRAEDGRFVQKRVILWQGVESGSTVVTNLCADLAGGTNRFPSIEVTITAVEPASPPPPPTEEDAE